MKKYMKEEVVYVPDFEGEYEACHIKTGAPKRGRLAPTKSSVIVLAEEELLDLMQEAVEHAYPTLLRETAAKLLSSKLQ